MTATVFRSQEPLRTDAHRFRAAGLADRARTLLADSAALLSVVFAVPVMILVVGMPFALAIVALLQAGRWVLNAL
jgi:hypothetical protein